MNLTKQKEPFQLIRVEKGFLPTTISNDASCSGTSKNSLFSLFLLN